MARKPSPAGAKEKRCGWTDTSRQALTRRSGLRPRKLQVLIYSTNPPIFKTTAQASWSITERNGNQAAPGPDHEPRQNHSRLPIRNRVADVRSHFGANLTHAGPGSHEDAASWPFQWVGPSSDSLRSASKARSRDVYRMRLHDETSVSPLSRGPDSAPRRGRPSVEAQPFSASRVAAGRKAPKRDVSGALSNRGTRIHPVAARPSRSSARLSSRLGPPSP